MDRPEDEKYWTSSATKGFDFDSDEILQESTVDIFGATPRQTAQLSKQIQEHIPHQHSTSGGVTHFKPSDSVSSLSTSSSSSYKVKLNQPNQQCEITCKLLSSTINDESVLSPKDIVRSIFLGMSFDLSSFKKLNDKRALLDEALRLGDGDTICAVLLFLQKSLHRSLLFTLLKERHSAAQEYLAVLEKQKAFKEAAMLCVELQQPKEAVIYLYNNCLRENDQNMLSALEMLDKVEFKTIRNIEFETEMLKEHIQLLQRQLAIVSSSSKTRAQQPELSSTRTSPLIGKPVNLNSLVGSSLLSTLQCCCRFNWDSPENLVVSPIGLRNTFKLTDKQFLWNAVIGKIISGNDPLPLLVAKSIFGTPKVTAGLSIPRILEIASHLSDQPNIFDQLLPMIDSVDTRYQLAKRYQRHRIAIDVLISNKDRIGLLQYRDAVNDQTEIDYINNTLRVSSTRWKN